MHKPVSSIYGEIKRMLLTFPGREVVSSDIVLQRYKGIFESLGENVEYVVLADSVVHDSIRQTVVGAGLDPERNLRLISAFSNYPAYVRKILRHIGSNVYECELESAWHSIWAQDGYCCLSREDGRTVILEPLDFTRGGDNFVADQVAAETDMEIEVTKYHLEGGNILAGDDYLIIGKDYLHLNQRITGESEEEITEGFKKVFGVSRLIWLGFDERLNFPLHVFQGQYQPIFHVDMYITLAGKSSSGKELVFVADANLAKSILGQPAPPAVIAQSFEKTADFLREYSEDGLEFDVKRLPIDLWDVSSTQGTFLTYNNCLIESYGGQTNAYVPAYSSVAPGSVNRRRLDKEVEEIFGREGVAVKLLSGSYEELCKRGGSVHCITKALHRE